MCQPSCLRQHCKRYQSTSCPCCGGSANMYAARQPTHATALMHGCTPVSARQLNCSYNDSNNVPHFSSFTTRQRHPAPAPRASHGQSHGIVSENSQLHSLIPHNGQGYGQSVPDSAKSQMSESQYSHFTIPDPSLDGSLLCSAWPPLPPSSHHRTLHQQHYLSNQPHHITLKQKSFNSQGRN